jgi:co-chaperonin GroES (HSP10)
MTETEEFTPLGDRLLLKRMEVNHIKGGIIIPETHEGKQLQYMVIAKAPHITDVQVGDEVLAVPDGGQKVKINGHGTCEIIEKRRIMGVIQYD